MAASSFSLKDQLFNRDKLKYLAGLFQAVDPGFDADGFARRVDADFPALELKQRITRIAEELENLLPGDYAAALDLLLQALPPPLDPSRSDDDFGDFIFAPLSEFVARNGIDRPDLSLPALCQITQRFSAEYAIRPFLNAHPDATLAALHDWTGHPNYHVRRLVSEGTRPKLPWGIGIDLSADAPLPLLDALHADPTRFVTRSVANHLNDISKRDPDLAMDTLRRWADAGRQEPSELAWMTRHALRGLVRQGHPDALALLGFDPDPPVSVGPILCEPTTVQIGGAMTFAVTLTARAPARLMVDYVLDLQGAGDRTRRKVFKLKQLDLARDAQVTLRKTHKFPKNATTITYHPGAQTLSLQVNGKKLRGCRITLTA